MNQQPVTTSNSDVVDRLVRLRSALHLMAIDLAAARRRANALAIENDRLARRVATLERATSRERPAIRGDRTTRSRGARSPESTPLP